MNLGGVKSLGPAKGQQQASQIIQLKKPFEDIIGNGRQKVLILGKTGTGKSSLCNVISGLPYNANVFPVSAMAASCTQETQLADVYFNGQIQKPIRNPSTIDRILTLLLSFSNFSLLVAGSKIYVQW